MKGRDVVDDEVRVGLVDGVMRIVLNRPESRNALSAGLLDGLAEALDRAEHDPKVRAVVLTGEGSAFCAGGDVARMARGESIFGSRDDEEGRARAQSLAQRRTVVRLHELGLPTIAMVNGPAVGAGLALALACDFRYAASSAVLMTGFSRVGLAGDFGCSWLLHRLAGRSTARELLFRSAPLSADDALARGLVTEVLPPDDLEGAVERVARRLASISPPAMAAMHAMSDVAGSVSLGEACDRDATTHARLVGTSEHRDAAASLAAAIGSSS